MQRPCLLANKAKLDIVGESFPAAEVANATELLDMGAMEGKRGSESKQRAMG